MRLLLFCFIFANHEIEQIVGFVNSKLTLWFVLAALPGALAPKGESLPTVFDITCKINLALKLIRVKENRAQAWLGADMIFEHLTICFFRFS